MYRYMLSYTSAQPSGISHGNCEITLPRPIRSMDDVDAVTRNLSRQYGLTNAILLAFSRFEDAGPQRTAS